MSICFAITDVDWDITKDVFSVLGTVVSAVGVALAAWVGFSGLATWRRQNKGTSDHDLSRRLLIDLYRLRDSIGHVRNPFVFGSEGEDVALNKGMSSLQVSYRNTASSYRIRFTQLDEIRVRLNTSLLESEAVWGGELKSRFQPIFKLQHELLLNVRAYLISINPDEEEDKVHAYRRILKNRRDVLYEEPLDGEDVFKRELDAALSRVEDFLRPKLIQ